MSFRIQDLIKMLIPGIAFIFLSMLLILDIQKLKLLSNLIKDTLAIWIAIFFVLAYVSGYFMDMLGSTLEKLFYKAFCKPSYILLNGFGIVKLYDSNKVKMDLSNNTMDINIEVTKKEAEKLFKFANILKNKSQSSISKELLSEYYYAKIFSRNLGSALFFSFLTYCVFYVFNFNAWTFNRYSFFIFFISILIGFRWRKQSLYYSRQVFYSACNY